MESHIPIEIHAQKLSEWLTSRKHCKKDWHSHIQPIRQKINEAIQDMPENNEIVQLLAGTYINYFYCKRIIEILRETEADTKNLFGSYGSQRMKDWLEIEKLYLKDNVYLAEACDLLVQNIKFHIPAVKKQIAKLQSEQTDCDKKIEDYTKSIQTSKKDLETLRKQFSIVDDNCSFKRTLIGRLCELQKVYDDVIEHVKNLKKANTYFSLFVANILGSDIKLTMLQYILNNGNSTYYEYLYGEKPSKIEEPVLTIEEDVKDTTDDEEIDWGDLENPSEDIDYGISLEESGIVVENVQTDGSIARGNEALTLLDNFKTKNEFMNDILELESFLSMRLLELSNETNSTLSVYSSEEINESKPEIASMLDIIKVVKQKLNDPVVQHLQQIKHSPRYLNKLESMFLQKINNIEKMVNSQIAVSNKKKELAEEYNQLAPKLKLIQQKNKQLITEIEFDISKKYKNRPVYIIGTSIFGS
ncbi:CDK5 regulatory subunit-associated protein 3 [Melanaphis sacchari]|uniref:CDK5 regulatory subunit-associated protein 3 n=1 Tax=Melanaphis sacchari TaxID=742174 RepID=A0A2H8TE34_9HEMI|nr:CDK5 regulatory subunit-associated protein 3 [Melanaphis sacchari]